ncbi:MAG: hypothetical protein HYX56_03815 [Chloroflexi bacterium]|nr:hypothetical protein [Chloroflexota bacterium]
MDPPGRDLLVSGRHNFADLAAAINKAFARSDMSHLHEFRLTDGRRVTIAEGADDLGETDPVVDLDERDQTLSSLGLHAGDSFTYAFDFGDDWEHRCTVLRTDVDPVKECGSAPSEITPIFGWGTIPDQYGRLSLDDDRDK